MNTVHIGQEIQKVFKQKGCTKTWFAQQLNFDRTNVYRIFKRKSIDTDLLFKICQILDYNFFALYNPKSVTNNHESMDKSSR